MLIGKNPLGLAPEWFINNIEYPSEQLSIDSSGVKINVRTWGSSKKKCLLFLHGFNAHTHWWDHVIPEFVYKLDIKRVINRGAIVGLADGEMFVDEKKIYSAEKLKVGLFKDPSNF